MSIAHYSDPLQDEPVDVEIKCEIPQIITFAEGESENEDEYPVESPLPLKLSVKKAAPVVLKPALKTYSQPRKKNPYPAKSVPTPTRIQSRDQFFKEGKSKIIGIINEARRLGIDPREYHPFYLRVHKQIADGQRLGYIGIEEEDVEELWREYDGLIDQVPVKEVYLEGEWENSPYALYIEKRIVCDRNGRRIHVQRDRQKLESRFMELGSIAKRIRSSWIRDAEEEDDLKARLEFFKDCRAMIHPADVVRMNAIWRKFREDCNHKSGSEAATVFTFRGGDEVPENFRCRVALRDVADDRMWKSKVRRLLLKRKLASVKIEIPSPPSSPSSPSSYNSSSPSYSPFPSKKRKKTTARRSNRIRSRSRTRSKSKPTSRKKSKSQAKTKPKRKPVLRLSKEELAKKKLRERRLAKFKRSRGKLKWTLRMICRKRRSWEILRIRRSAEVAITLEKVVSSSCRLRTLKNRKKWRKLEEKRMSLKKKNTKKNHNNVPCPYCEKLFKNERAIGGHIAVKHPKKISKYKKLQLEKERQKSREAYKRFRETGEGPKWMKRRRDFGRTPRKPAVCDQCGKTLCDKSGLKLHVSTVHKPDQSKSRCPKCNEAYTDGVLLWFHFQSKHLNHDVLKLSRAKAEQMGWDLCNPTPAKPKPKPIREYEKITRILNDAGIEEYRCDVCLKSFDTVEITKRHLNNVHQEEKQWLCHVCGKTFKGKDNRDAHVKQIHEGQDYRCDICGRKLQTKGKLWRHKVEVHEMRDLEPPGGITVEVCPYCGVTMLRGMQAHVKKLHPEKLTEFMKTVKVETKEGATRPYGPRSRSHGPFPKKSEKAKLNYRQLRREQERKWKEEGILDAPWIARSIRPNHNCPFCGVSMATIPTRKGWIKHLDILCEGDPPIRSKTGATTATAKTESLTTPKWVCPVEGCEEKFYAVRVLDVHIMKHSNAYDNLEKEKYLEMVETAEFSPKEFHCLVCKKETKEEVKVPSKGAIIIHFAVNHPQLYNQYRGEMEPEVEENAEYLKTESIDIKPLPQPPPPQPVAPKKSVTAAARKTVAASAPILPNPKKYPCPHCPVELFSDLDLRCHIEVTHQDKCWRCPDPSCTKVILSPLELQKHFMEDHKDY